MYFFPILPKSRAAHKSARALYASIEQRSREPVFYADYAVPDTLDGRFDMIALHVGLLIDHVRTLGPDGQRIAQAIFDEMVLRMEQSCRQLGIGDLGVPRQIKKMMQALQGRAVAYAESIKANTLDAALQRNLYATVDAPSGAVLNGMADYIKSYKHQIDQTSIDVIKAGQFNFPPLPQGKNHDENDQAA